MNIIRKISVGPDYIKSMIYEVGKKAGIDGHVVTSIVQNDDRSIDIFISNAKKEKYKWKSISCDVPVSIEYDINF